jgi:hypothetical protein
VLSSHKGKLKKIILRDILVDIRLVGPSALDMTLGCVPGKTVRPTEVLKQVFGVPEEMLSQISIRKLKNQATHQER